MHARSDDMIELAKQENGSDRESDLPNENRQTIREAKTELHEFLTQTRLRIRSIAQSVAAYNAIEDAKASTRRDADQRELERLRQIADSKISDPAQISEFEQYAETPANATTDQPSENSSATLEDLLPNRIPGQTLPEPTQVANDSFAMASVLQSQDEFPSRVDGSISQQDLPSSSPLTADGVDPLERLNAIKQRLAKQIENS
jgi:hypothetical protein